MILKIKEQNKYEVIKELVDHNGNTNHAALKLGLSVRQINHSIKNIEKGNLDLIHL